MIAEAAIGFSYHSLGLLSDAGHNLSDTGDMHRGQSLVVWAIREGREAAREVDESLMGYSYLSVQ